MFLVATNNQFQELNLYFYIVKDRIVNSLTHLVDSLCFFYSHKIMLPYHFCSHSTQYFIIVMVQTRVFPINSTTAKIH